MRYISFTCPFCNTETRYYDDNIIHFIHEEKLKCIICDNNIDNWIDQCMLIDDTVSWNDYFYIDPNSKEIKWYTDKLIEPYMSEKDLLILMKNNVIEEDAYKDYLRKWRDGTCKFINLILTMSTFEKVGQNKCESIEEVRHKPLSIFFLDNKKIFKPYPIDEKFIFTNRNMILLLSENIIEDFCKCKGLKYSSSTSLDHMEYSSHQGRIVEFHSLIFNIEGKFNLKCFVEPSIFGILSYQGYNYAFCIDVAYNLYVVPDNRYIKTGKHIPCIEMDDYS